DYEEILEMLGEGIAVGTGRAAHYLHRDRINGVLRGRRGARSTAIQCGGAIPEIADYRVIAEPEGTFVGTLDEDFSIESMAGDIVLLGTTSWRIKRIESAGIVRVENAHGAPPTIPFWNGEAPGRTIELSEEVSDLRIELAHRITTEGDLKGVIEWAEQELALPRYAAEQIVQYIKVQGEMMGLVPSQKDVVFERFFDESGGMQLVVHAPFGARINRAWGLALRKRFCVSFDFELQAAATDDAMLLSIGPNNSFPLETMFQLVKKPWVQESVEQALLVANSPVWQSRWRWNSTRSLAVLRQRNGKRVPPPLQRMKADDLMAAVFPVLVACQENLSGPIPLPDHPLTRQSMNDCLHEAMDLDGLCEVLDKIEAGDIQFHARDTTEPSPFAHEMINSPVYSFLDDAPLEERRARSVMLRRSLPKSGRDLGILDPDAIELVVDEAQPQPRSAEEVHETLLSLVALRPAYAPEWQAWFDELVSQHRASTVESADGDRFWFAAENLALIAKLFTGADIRPAVQLPPELQREVEEEAARLAIVRGHMEILGPTTVRQLADRTALDPSVITSALAHLENEGGSVMRGRFRPIIAGDDGEEWCDRRLLARIHRFTLDRLRSEIEPVSAADLMRFLLRWQHLAPGTQLEGKRGLLEAITQLQGYDIPAVAWERHILPTRVAEYRGSWLDELCIAGDVSWARFAGRKGDVGRSISASTATPISFARRSDLPWLVAGIRNGGAVEPPKTGAAGEIHELLQARGALFYDDIVTATNRLPGDVERGLWDLVARGIATADGFQALRSLMASTKKRSFRRPQRARLFRTLAVSGVPSGRWSLLPVSGASYSMNGALEGSSSDDEQIWVEELAEAWAEQLLFRYGVVFRDLVRAENVSVPWREILRALRRMEAQGVVRGGRFVSGFYGEQYARPEAVEALRGVRRTAKTGELVRVSAVDPLNLTGVITPGPRVTSIHTKTVVYRDGVPVQDGDVFGEEPLAAAG
ncbi:MAG: DEAD/DEAH box helicase, partial [Chloroflexota bacterium]